MGALARIVTGRRSKWVVVLGWIVLVFAFAPLGSRLGDVTDNRTESFLPSDAESTEALRVQEERFPGGETVTGLVVYRRPGGLTGADRERIAAGAARAADELPLLGPPVVPFQEGAPPELVSPAGDLAPGLPTYAFIFLVALGIDYTIFLMSRVREEARRYGTREGTLRALAATGPVITSAGIILAGTFSVLMTLPVTFIFDLGFMVAVGILLDTFVVRTIMVPAIVELIGDRIWWPSSPGGGRHALHEAAPAPVST